VIILISTVIVILRIVSWYAMRTHDTAVPDNIPRNLSVADPEYEESINTARAQLLQLYQERETPSISITVSAKGKIIWSEAFGYRDAEKKMVATCTTVYRAHSVSKLFTASLAGKLYEQGKFSWDEDIRNQVTEFPGKKFVITPRHLASHRSGIRGYRDDNEAVQTKNYPSVTESLAIFKDDPLVFEPGTQFLYSGFGYVLLSAFLEKVSNEKFTDLVHNEVFQHLGMDHSFDALNKNKNEAIYYDNVTPYSTDGRMVVSPANNFSFKLAAGGFLTTSEDLVKFGNAHIKSLHKNFLTDGTLDLLLEPQGSPVPGFGYGLGWMSAIDPDLRAVRFHFGAGSGGTSLLVIYPEQEVCVAMLSNLGHARFPMNRLLRIADSFQYSPTKIIFNVWLVIVLVALAYKVTKRSKHKPSRL
jgi:serine beta-lactamase-like protein LACTB, mitochondrial